MIVSSAEAALIVSLAPASAPLTVEELVALPTCTALPFESDRRALLSELSQRILRDPILRADPASVALAYWLRRANLDRLNRQFEHRQSLESDIVFVAAGRVFHVAPGNVDTVFIYSWALSYLCGNHNLVRVSGQANAIVASLLRILDAQMQENSDLAAANRFITYPHDDTISAALSQWANHRVTWGGDQTVTLFRALPLSPHASERAFGSKFSYSVISADAYNSASEHVIAALAAGYFNDIFWFEQMACSSPHLIVWVGTPSATRAGLPRFHAALEHEIERRGHIGSPSSAVRRFNYVFDLACDTELRVDLRQKEFLGIELADGEVWRKEICGAGVLTHVRADRLNDLAAFASERDQTITHFGFSIDELRNLARAAGVNGIDRIVPVGEALAFEANWDGFDLLGDFMRRVTVRGGSTQKQ